MKALNRITVPRLPLKEFFLLARDAGCDAVEVRNDLPGGEIFDGLSEDEVRRLSEEHSIRIVTINALQRFNDVKKHLQRRTDELRRLAETAQKAAVDAVVLCPVNDPDEQRSYGQRMEDTVTALSAFGSVFREAGVLGYIEPLGFTHCSLRSKKDALQAITESGYHECFRIVHDTFHHFLSGDVKLYPQDTGIVHMSGVLPGRPQHQITDADRVLVTREDVMSTRQQVQTLTDQGFSGCFSFEPFSQDVQNLDVSMLTEQLKQSFSLLFD